MLASDWFARSHVVRYVIVAILVSAGACQRERERTRRNGSARERNDTRGREDRDIEAVLRAREYDYFVERRRRTILVNKDRSRTTRKRLMVAGKRNEVREDGKRKRKRQQAYTLRRAPSRH